MASKYPLLLKGFFSNPDGSDSSIVSGLAPVSWTNMIPEGRGNLIMVDPVVTNYTQSGNLDSPGTFNYKIAGQTVMIGMAMSRYAIDSVIGSYELLKLNQPAGQTIQLDMNATGGPGMVIHHYFENQFLIPSVIEARQSNKLKQKIQSFRATFVGGQRIERSGEITIPTTQGNIVAIELECTHTSALPDAVLNSLISLYVDGTSIIENAASIVFAPTSGRKGLIFPIVIRPGSTLIMEADTSASTNTEDLVIDLRVYYDDDFTGTKEYA
jgi:hypothetical protein